MIQNNFLLHSNHIISILDLDLEECIIPKDTYLFPTTFYQCKNIKHIEIMSPTKIDNIDFSNMFQDSEQIESITLPKEVKLSNVPISVKIIRNTKR